jgi:hypothetical protein
LFAFSQAGTASRNTSAPLPRSLNSSRNSANPRSKPKPEPATAFATKPAVVIPWALSSSASVRRSFGSRAEKDTSLWCRSGCCDVHTDDIAPSV